MATAEWDRFASFGDILYGVVIGFGFTFFPDAPREHPLQTALFLWTLVITAQDWYQFHSLYGPRVAEGERGQALGRWQFFSQLVAILALYQMFVHAGDATMAAWLAWAIVFLAATAWWNLITPYPAHRAYAAIDVGLALVLAALVLAQPAARQSLGDDWTGWLQLGVTVALAVGALGFLGPALERRAADRA